MAQDTHNTGDRWVPSEEARGLECALYPAPYAGLSGWFPLTCICYPKNPFILPIFSRGTLPRTISPVSLSSTSAPFDLIVLVIFSQPPQFKLDPRLARLLGLHTQSRSAIVQALWQYVKTNRLQDSHDKEYINGDKYFQQVTGVLSARLWGAGIVTQQKHLSKVAGSLAGFLNARLGDKSRVSPRLLPCLFGCSSREANLGPSWGNGQQHPVCNLLGTWSWDSRGPSPRSRLGVTYFAILSASGSVFDVRIGESCAITCIWQLRKTRLLQK